VHQRQHVHGAGQREIVDRHTGRAEQAARRLSSGG